MKNRLISIVLMALLLWGFLPSEPTAAAAAPIISVQYPGNAKPGDTVDVRLWLSNNPGIACTTLEIGYDAAVLRLDAPDRVSKSTALSSLMFVGVNASTYGDNPFKAIWAGSDDDHTNGELLTIQFTVLQSAKNGPSLITVSNDTRSQDGTKIAIETINTGSLTVIAGTTTNPENSPNPKSPSGGGSPTNQGNTTNPTTGGEIARLAQAAAENLTPPEAEPAPVAGWSNPYVDVKENDWFYNPVRFVTEQQLMKGTGADVFSPNSTMTRAMLVTVLYRLEGRPAVSGISSFTDVRRGEWYTEAIDWVQENNIVNGYANGEFGVNDSVTREQTVAILYRYSRYKGYDISRSADLAGYSDGNQISDWALDPMKWAVAEGIVAGRTAATLVPQGISTRAEIATVLQRYLAKG